jgi:hypothetical protein
MAIPSGLVRERTDAALKDTRIFFGAFAKCIVAVVLLGATAVALVPAASCSTDTRQTVRIAATGVLASSQDSRHAAAYTTDGRLASRWIAANGRFPQWVRIDLGTVRQVDTVRLSWPGVGQRKYTYRLRASTNGTSWRAYSPRRPARFLKIIITSCSAKRAWASLREVRVYGPPLAETAQPATPANPSQPPRTTRTVQHLVVPSGTHDVVYENVRFVGGGNGNPDSSGVIEIHGTAYRITFRDCIIETNGDGVGNGVKIVDRGGTVHDILFEGCHIMSQPRMGFECINRPGSRSGGYSNVNLVGCTFEPQGSEAISFDDDSNGKAGQSVIQGCVIKGAGINRDYPWGQGLEINGPTNMTVRDSRFYACRGDIWNLRMSIDAPCGWVFSGNVIDASTRYQSVAMDSTAGCVAAVNIVGGVFSQNSITSAPPGGGVAWLSDCHDMDWRTTTWHDQRGTVYTTPFQVDCSGNLF